MHINNYKNHLLIAMPSMQGDFFSKAVILIYEHNESGAIGFTINKPLSATLGNVMDHLNIKMKDKSVATMPVFSGGPVGPDQGFIIHDRLDENDEDTEVTVSTSRDILQEIANGKGPAHFLISLGYSGWEPGQLEIEIRQNDWLLAPFQKSILFDIPISERWITAARLMGVDVNKLSSQSGNA